MLRVKAYINGKKTVITSKNVHYMDSNTLKAVKPALLSIDNKVKAMGLLPDLSETEAIDMVYNAQSLIPLVNKRLGFLMGEPLRANRLFGWKY